MAASETTQLFSSSSDEMRRFIFNRLQKMDNQRALYTLRRIQKSEQIAVEKKIQTAKIGFPQIKQFATSNFWIKFLRVSVRVDDSFDDLKYLSTTYLPNAQNIHVKIYQSFYQGLYWDRIKLKIHEPQIFQRLHVQNQSRVKYFHIYGNYNVEIRDCKFIGIGVFCENNASIFVTGSKFQNSVLAGLEIAECASVYINKIIVENCRYSGLRVRYVKEDVNISNVRAVSCGCSGIYLTNKYINTTNFNVSDTTIKDCSDGINVGGWEGGEIQKTNIEGCKRSGIYIRGGAIVRYAFVEFNHNVENIKIDDDGSQFLPLKVIT